MYACRPQFTRKTLSLTCRCNISCSGLFHFRSSIHLANSSLCGLLILVHASEQQNVSLPQVTYHQLQEAFVLVCFSIDLNPSTSINLPVPSNRQTHAADYSVHRKSAWLLLIRADQVQLPNSQSLADCLSSAEHQHSALLYDRQGVILLLFGRKRSFKFGSELKMDTLRRNKVTTILQCKQPLNIFCA